MKKCSICGETKPAEGFQIRRASADERTAACKNCLSKRDAARLYDPKRKAARRQVALARRADPEKTAADVQSKQEWQARNPEKRHVHVTVGNAIRDGKIDRPTACERCGEAADPPIAHHDDYEQPLAVRWLCTACHGWLCRRVAA